MSFKDDLRNKLGDLFEEVVDRLGDDFNYDQVPRTRLNAVIKQRNEARDALAELTGDTQHQEGGNPNGSSGSQHQHQQQQNQSQKSIEELRQEWETEHNKQMNALRIEFAGLDELRKAGSVDADLAYSLIDKEKLTFDSTGKKITGIEEQITALKESKPYLFKQSAGGRNQTPGGTGKEGGSEQFETVKGKDDFLKLKYEDQIKFKQIHPELFKQYLNS